MPGIKEERNILHTIKQRKSNWTGYILRMNCLEKNVIERKKEEMTVIEEEDVSRYRVTLREIENNNKLKVDALISLENCPW